ncbi:MAG: translation elongation factor Ts [Spirosomataceae bacterium]
MAITAADVNKLRQMTGAGMMDCKKALTEADGDFEQAVDILRKQGQKVAAKRADNVVSEGLVLVHVSPDGTNGKIIGLACETEPVSKVESFQNLAMSIMSQAVATNASDKATLLATVQGDGQTLEAQITELIGKIGEKIELIAYENVTADVVSSYLHSNNKRGVLVAFTGVNGADLSEVGRDVAMQVAAMKPVAVNKEDVDAATIEREIEIGKELARNEGKAEAMLEKIAMGRLNKFYKESTLMNQEFIKDGSMTIAQLLEKTQKGLAIKTFKHIAIGG